MVFLHRITQIFYFIITKTIFLNGDCRILKEKKHVVLHSTYQRFLNCSTQIPRNYRWESLIRVLNSGFFSLTGISIPEVCE